MKYQNAERICGEIDCNILAFELYEPELYEKMKGTFKTILQGVKNFKRLTGCFSYNEYMSKHKYKYKLVQPHQMREGDIVSYTNSNCVAVIVGTRAFGVLEVSNKEIFRTFSIKWLRQDNRQIYRRI